MDISVIDFPISFLNLRVKVVLQATNKLETTHL